MVPAPQGNASDVKECALSPQLWSSRKAKEIKENAGRGAEMWEITRDELESAEGLLSLPLLRSPRFTSPYFTTIALVLNSISKAYSDTLHTFTV